MASASSNLAQALVDYDRELALTVARAIAAQLGAVDVAEWNAEQVTSHLLAVTPEGWTSATTSEWKTDFAHTERLRALGIELAGRL